MPFMIVQKLELSKHKWKLIEDTLCIGSTATKRIILVGRWKTGRSACSAIIRRNGLLAWAVSCGLRNPYSHKKLLGLSPERWWLFTMTNAA